MGAGTGPGHWEYQAYYQFIDGEKLLKYKKVWVSDPVRKPTVRKAAGPSSSQKAAAARAAAKAAAAAKAQYQMKLAKARAEAFANLQRRQVDLLRKSRVMRDEKLHATDRAKPPVPAAPVAPAAPKNPALEGYSEHAASILAMKNRRAAEAAANQAKQNEADTKRWSDYARHQIRRRVLRDFKSGDPRSAANIEKQLEDELRRAKETGAVDNDYIEELAKRYDQHVDAVLDRLVGKDDAEGDRGGGLFYKLQALLDKGDKEGASKLYFSPEFQGLWKEYHRLMQGKGKTAKDDGSSRKFNNSLNEIANVKREWWKRQLRSSLPQELKRMARVEGGQNSAEQDQIREVMGILNGQTGWVLDASLPGGRRRRTVDEELDYRDAMLMARREKLIATRLNEDRRRKSMMMREGLVEYNGAVIPRENVSFMKDSEKLVLSDYGGKVPALNDSKDVQKFADGLVRDWEKRNPPPPYIRGTASIAYKAWQQRKEDYERRAYQFFGSTTPAMWERLVNAPVVSHALAGLNVSVAGLGAGARVSAKILTGSSTIGYSLDWSTAPRGAPDPRRIAAEEYAKIKASGALPNARTPLAIQAEIKRQQDAWLKTPEGKAWYDAQIAEEKVQSQKEDEAFNKGFYGDGDIGARVQALNDYGNEPFENPAANLVFALVADPLNAIPLNFLKYPLRGAAALDAAKVAKAGKFGIGKEYALVKAFLTSDEGALYRYSQKIKVAKAYGTSPQEIERAIADYDNAVRGIKKLDERGQALEKVMRDRGLLRRENDPAMLYNLAEAEIMATLRKRAIPLRDEAQKLDEKMAAQKKVQDEAAAEAEAKVKADREIKLENDRIEAARQQAARDKLAREKKISDERIARDAEVVESARLARERARSPYAQFGTKTRMDRHGNVIESAELPSSFRHEDGYVYHVGNSANIGKDRAPGLYVSKRPSTIYHKGTTSVIYRMKESLGFSAAESGVNAQDNLRSINSISAHDMEVLTADGRWVPATTESLTPGARSAAERAGVPPFRDPSTGNPRPFVDEFDSKILGLQDEIDALSDRIEILSRRGNGDLVRQLRAQSSLIQDEIDRLRSVQKALHDKYDADVAAALNRADAEANARETPPQAPDEVNIEDTPVRPPVKTTELQWIRKEKAIARGVLRSRASTAAEKNAARRRMSLLDDAENGIIRQKRTAQFANRVDSIHGDESIDVIPANEVSPFVQSLRDIEVEGVRTAWKRLQSSPPGPVQGSEEFILRHGKRVPFMSRRLYAQLDKVVSDAIREYNGRTNEFLTRGRRVRGKVDDLPGEDPDIPNVSRMSDYDKGKEAVKKKAIDDFNRSHPGTRITVKAYDEARAVMWKPLVQTKASRFLLREAQELAAKTGIDLEEAFLRVRKVSAHKQARMRLKEVATEMYGFSPAEVFAEFLRRYGDDGTIFYPKKPLSSFQRNTLERYIMDSTGFDKLDDRMSEFLQSANRPPFENRTATKNRLVSIGAWSPRKSEKFVSDEASWSVAEEAQYWYTNYGYIPEWADMQAMSRDGKVFFRDSRLHYEQLRTWGVFNQRYETELRISGKSGKEIEEEIRAGRRSLATQRKYAIERYGSAVSQDGKRLDEMPWLMYEDELQDWLAKVTLENQEIPAQYIQSAEELAEFHGYVRQAMEPLFKKYVDEKLVGGVFDQADLLEFASQLQAILLANPKWAKRTKDILGDTLNFTAWLQRWAVFNNPSFFVTNTVDAAFVKTPYFRLTRRSIINNPEAAKIPGAVENAEKAGLADFGILPEPAIYRVKNASAKSRILNPRGYTRMERAVDRAIGLFEGSPLGSQLYPEMAGRVERHFKLKLAREMYPSFYQDGLRHFGTSERGKVAADLYAKKTAGEYAQKMWPTTGDGPLERLWSRIVPFSSYTIRNKVMFVGELADHPAVFNYVNAIGRFIEEENLRQWEEDHPGTEMPENLRRRIRLPWAPDHYLDLSTFSDVSRGLEPIFRDKSKQTVMELAASWVRVVNPSAQATVYGLLNAFGVAQKTAWIPVLDAGGNPTGRYERVTVGWNEPWSDQIAHVGSALWFVEVVERYNQLSPDGLSPGDISELVGMTLFFNGIKTFDRGSVLNSFYMNLKEKNPDAVKSWLLSEDGRYLQAWWQELNTRPSSVKDLLRDYARIAKDPAPWFHDQSPEFQARVKEGQAIINKIRRVFRAELMTMEYGTAEFKETKARMYAAIDNVYLNYPEVMQSQVWSKSPVEWSAQLADWQADKLTDDFMALAARRPDRDDFQSQKAYEEAVEKWKHDKKIFLETYPQVKENLSTGAKELDAARDLMNADWDKTLTRISARNERIAAAKKILESAGRDSASGQNAQERLDILYLQNELDYALLERDYSARYFTDEDFKKLPKGSVGPPTLAGDIIKRTTTLLDFDRARYEKAVREGRGAEFLRNEKYNKGLHDVILAAKGGNPFGKFDPGKFIKAMLADPWLSKQYFAKPENKGKQELWKKNADYIRYISVWGKLASAGRWDEANRAWDALPQWVKNQYYANNPERRRTAQQTVAYLGYMQKWVSMFDTGDKKAAMAYFRSLPAWVKERYYAKHPDKRAQFELDDRMSQKLVEYFAGDDKYRSAYLAKNPDLARWLARNSSGSSGERAAIMAAYRTIPKGEAWLRKVFREKYPEIFSQEAAGKRKLKRVYDTLSSHPSMLPSYEVWLKATWAAYLENLKHLPRPASSYFEMKRDVPAREYKRSMSAAEVSRLH